MIYFSHLIDFLGGGVRKGFLKSACIKNKVYAKQNKNSRQFTERPYQTLPFEYFIYLFTELFVSKR